MWRCLTLRYSCRVAFTLLALSFAALRSDRTLPPRHEQGYTLISAGHPKPAIEALSHALELEPDNYGEDSFWDAHLHQPI